MATPPVLAEDAELKKLELLRNFKQRLSKPGGEILTPFDDNIVTETETVSGYHVDAIHAEVRKHIVEMIEKVRLRGQSEVILLAGEAGSGKSHLLRYFHQPEIAEQHEYIYAGSSNHWQIEEFIPYLLDLLIRSLTVPNADGDHLLLSRVRTIGYRAVQILLENRKEFQICQRKPKGWKVFRWLKRLSAPSHESVAKQLQEREPNLFDAFEPTSFGTYVCDRFLAEPNNLTHRYAMRVLLTLLFPENHDGVGGYERVLHWFQRRNLNGYFLKKLGVEVTLDKQFEQMDAIRLLVHLFSQEVSQELDSAEFPCPSKVFLIVFDQSEGRDELFDSDEDWRDFFAHLSELYNTLPNLLLLFTMTLSLRTRLHGTMEQQFKDRIRQEKRFTLSSLQLDSSERIELYRTRIRYWLKDSPEQLAHYDALNQPTLPLSENDVASSSTTESMRYILNQFDTKFRQAMRDRIVEPDYDFHYRVNELRPSAQSQNVWDYTTNHLDTVKLLLHYVGAELATDAGVQLGEVSVGKNRPVSVIVVEFTAPNTALKWIKVNIARFGNNYTSQLPMCEKNLLKGKNLSRNFVWLVRPALPVDASVPRPDQMFWRECPLEVELRFQALNLLLADKDRYVAENLWDALLDVVQREVNQTYLGELFRDVEKRAKSVVEPVADETQPSEID